MTYGALLGTEGVSTVLCPLNKLARALAGDVAAGCAVVVGTGDDLAAALEQVHALRSADSAAQRRTGIVLLASEELDQARAEAAEVDRVVVLPAHLRQIVDSIDAVLDRVADEAGQSFSKFSQ